MSTIDYAALVAIAALAVAEFGERILAAIPF